MNKKVLTDFLLGTFFDDPDGHTYARNSPAENLEKKPPPK